MCGLSTQLRQMVTDFDEVLLPSDADFINSGVVQPSVIRLGFLSTIPTTDIQKMIGLISRERHQRLIRRLTDYLLQTP